LPKGWPAEKFSDTEVHPKRELVKWGKVSRIRTGKPLPADTWRGNREEKNPGLFLMQARGGNKKVKAPGGEGGGSGTPNTSKRNLWRLEGIKTNEDPWVIQA